MTMTVINTRRELSSMSKPLSQPLIMYVMIAPWAGPDCSVSYALPKIFCFILLWSLNVIRLLRIPHRAWPCSACAPKIRREMLTDYGI